MENISAMCPQCKKQQTVNPSEEVAFCCFCNKPFAVKDAIKQYTESLERSEASKKPSDAAIAKFNAILAQDYKLAEKYLEDVINKEYSQNCKKHLIFKISTYNKLITIATPESSSKGYLSEVLSNLNSIRSVNSYIAEMYYKILCANVNNAYNYYHGNRCNGELAFLKIQMSDIEYRIKQIRNTYSSDRREDILNDIINDICRYKNWLKQEYDDAYITDLIAVLRSSYCLKGAGGVNRALAALKNMLSPNGREKQERWEKFQKESDFWNRYITLLNAKRIKEAYEHLKKASCTDAYKSEIAKFHKAFFGIKYNGDVSSLKADTLAELALNSLT